MALWLAVPALPLHVRRVFSAGRRTVCLLAVPLPSSTNSVLAKTKTNKFQSAWSPLARAAPVNNCLSFLLQFILRPAMGYDWWQ